MPIFSEYYFAVQLQTFQFGAEFGVVKTSDFLTAIQFITHKFFADQ